MRRICRLGMALLCAVLLTTAVFAQSSATVVDNQCTVTSDGYCDVTLNVTLNLEQPAANLTFPLPKNAKDVTMNGGSVRTYGSADDANVILADLSGLNGIVGSYSMTFRYGISNVLKTVEKKLYMEIPLLCGFDYPVETLNFRIIMPGEVSGKPTFSSAFLQTGMESIVQCAVGGSLISGSVSQTLSERETMTLTMPVSEQMFPGKLIVEREGNPEAVPMAVCAVLALVYWLVLMRCLPPIRQRQITRLDGVTAGELGCRLTTAGVDLTMMVFSWAQLGYLQIAPDKYGRVLLYRRMKMGNERTEFENRYFQRLFAKSDVADATGMAYAQLCRQAAETVSGVREMHRRQAGSARVFRAVAALASLFSGVCLAMNLTANSMLQLLLAVVLGAAGFITAWGIQGGMYKLHLRGKVPVGIGCCCAAVWVALGVAAGQVLIAVLAVLIQVAAGLMAAYGGRRSDLGRYQAGQILGLRHYLKRIPREEVLRNMQNDPDYFFDMLPYAIALGVDRPFAARFGRMKLPDCAYVAARRDRQRTAAEWAALVRRTADAMDSLPRRLELRQWVPLPSAPRVKKRRR